MNKLWNYEDYVSHLSHESMLVRRWAFNALENRFANRYEERVVGLLNDENEYLACVAPKYLALHEAVWHAPAILESFRSGQGNVPGSCAGALAKMKYEPAVDAMLEYLENPRSVETILGVFDYLGSNRNRKCHDALRFAVVHAKDTLLLGAAIRDLLHHRNPEDLELILEKYFASQNPDSRYDMLLKNIASPLGAGDYFTDLTDSGRNNLLEKPDEAINGLLSTNTQIEIDKNLLESMIESLQKGKCEDFATMIVSDSNKIINARYPQNERPDYLDEFHGQDAMCMALLEDLSRRSAMWKQVENNKELGTKLANLIVSVYFAVKEREAYLGASHPEAGVEELLLALRNTGSVLPMPIRKKIRKLAPVSELKANLTEDLATWGDIWTVRLMGQIGDRNFVPDLVYVLQNSDGIDYIYSDAIASLNALDESADEDILAAIENKDLGECQSFPILEHMPYAEAYDLAVRFWEGGSDDKMHFYEMYVFCLKGIGDKRGIATLQNMYANDTDAEYVGDCLECLGKIHNISIPESAEIEKKRKEHLEMQRDRQIRLNELAEKSRIKKESNAAETKGAAAPFKRDTPKVGRNDPCPCGSGKKYKKCCLNKR